MSSKRQITIPAEIVRELDLQPGAKLAVWVDDGEIVLHPRPQSWLEHVTGPPHGLYGRTKEEIDAYIREVREGWDERARKIEGEHYRGPDG